MKNGLFRDKVVDRVTAPDQLNDYIKVVPIRAWLVLAAVVIVLAGALYFVSTTEVDLVHLIFG